MPFAESPDGSIWLDHVLLGTPDVDRTTRELADALGVEPVVGGRHQGLGTRNTILGLTGSYLEIIGPDEDDETFSGRRWFGIDDLTEARVVSWSAGVADLDAVAARSTAAGWDPGELVSQSRDAEGGTISWRRSDTSLELRGSVVVPFLVEWTDSPSPADTLPPAATIEGLTLEHPDPEQVVPVLEALGLGHLGVGTGPERVRVTLRAGDRSLTI